MKKVLLLAVALMMVASIGMAQPGHIGLYSDTGYSDCNLAGPLPAFPVEIPVYVVHQLSDGVLGSQFKLVDNSGLFFSSYTSNHALNIGTDPFVETAVTYDGGCQSTPVLIGTIKYFDTGGATACNTIEVVAAPTPGQIVVDTCGPEQEGTGGILTILGDETCPCIVGTEETSWGKIKSLYN